jgi:hypothetical protein
MAEPAAIVFHHWLQIIFGFLRGPTDWACAVGIQQRRSTKTEEPHGCRDVLECNVSKKGKSSVSVGAPSGKSR